MIKAQFVGTQGRFRAPPPSSAGGRADCHGARPAEGLLHQSSHGLRGINATVIGMNHNPNTPSIRCPALGL